VQGPQGQEGPQGPQAFVEGARYDRRQEA